MKDGKSELCCFILSSCCVLNLVPLRFDRVFWNSSYLFIYPLRAYQYFCWLWEQMEKLRFIFRLSWSSKKEYQELTSEAAFMRFIGIFS